MANILCIYENIIATVAGTVKFLKELSEYDNRINTKAVSIYNLKVTDITWCDILYMIRPNNECFARIARVARDIGVIVIFFLDDDLMNLPKENPDMPWRKIGLANAAQQSDIVASTSPHICRAYGDRYHVSRTVLIDSSVPQKDIKEHKYDLNPKIKIVYAAGVRHKVWFDKYIRPILSDIDKLYSNRISLTFMGVHPDINPNDYNIPIEFISSLPFDEYRKRIEIENFDIGLAPLDCSDFTKCKYFNKYIEYAMFGIVGIYSDTEPYTFVVKNRENGILVGDTSQSWLKAICEAIDNSCLIQNCRENAYISLKTRFKSTTIINGFIHDIPEVIREHTNKQLKGNPLLLIKFRYFLSRIMDWVYKTGFYFKSGGIIEVVRAFKRRINTIKIENRTQKNE